MSAAMWVLIVASHVNSGAVVSMHDFNTRDACEVAATASRKMVDDVAMFGAARTWCVPKGEKQ